MKSKTKRLYRSNTGRVFSGLLAGIGEYFDTDPVVIRLIFILATAFTGFGPGLVAYIVGSIVVPNEA
jgi:phage shock protein C